LLVFPSPADPPDLVYDRTNSDWASLVEVTGTGVEVTGTGAIFVQLSWFVMPCCPVRFRPRTKPVQRGI
jgi:hypothetical protein